jgi:hypothetical protein
MPDPSMLPPSLPSESSEPTPKEVEWMSYVLREHARLHRDAADAQPTPEMEAQCLREAEVSEWLASHLPGDGGGPRRPRTATQCERRSDDLARDRDVRTRRARSAHGITRTRGHSRRSACRSDRRGLRAPEPRKLTLQEAAKIVVRVLRPAAARVRPEPPTRETSNG